MLQSLSLGRIIKVVHLPFAVGCCWLAVILTAPPVSAQPAAAQYEEINSLPNAAGKEVDLTPYKDPKKLSLLRSSLLPLASEGKAAGNDLVRFETFVLARIAEFTWPLRDPVKDTPEQRRMLLKREVSKVYGGTETKSPELHDFFNATILRIVPTLVDDDRIDPAVRYNYVILLGQIDKLEFILSVRTIPEPVPECTTILIEKLQKDSLPESLRVAAWIGLARQSETILSPLSRQTTIAEALKYVGAKQPLPGYSQSGHHWSRKLALQSIGALALNGREISDRTETVKLLYDIIVNEEEPLFLRREAALALGSLDPAMFAKGPVKPDDILKALSRFALQLSRAGGGLDPADPGNMAKAENVFPPPIEEEGVKPENSNKKLFADGVAYYLNCVATALGGRSNRGLRNAPGFDKALVDELLRKHIDPTVIALGAPYAKLDVNKMPADLQKMGDNLRSWMQDKSLIAAAGGGSE